MEMNILNEILSSTVSGLFSNKIKHIKYIEEYTSPRYKGVSAKECDGKEERTKTQQTKNKSQTVEEWTQTIGKSKVSESARLLNLDKSKIKNTDYTHYDEIWLIEEKDKIKEELKKYDEGFFSYFNRNPNNSEKEIMRPIYIYYKLIKKAIETKKTFNPPKLAKSNSDMNLSCVRGLKKQYHSPTNYISDNSTHTSSNRDTVRLSNLQISKLEEEYINLKKEQVELELIIYNFRRQFYETYNRNPEYYEELSPIEEEFDKFKQNNERLKELRLFLFGHNQS